MVSALGNGVKGGKWFSLIDKAVRPATLDIAWQRVARNKGAAGVDGQSIERFAAQSARYLQELQRSLTERSYRPDPVKRVEIPKADGKTRPLGIPTVKDRIVQTALKMVIEPIFEVQFRPGSFGFRPGRGCKDALREVDRLLKEGYTHVVDADLKSYFDTIPHGRLMALVKGSISDSRVLALIDGFLQQEIMSEIANWQPTTGTPQGAVLSPLLANLYLHPLDLLMEQGGYRMVRYADDFVILCASEAVATAALRQVTTWVNANGLTLHPDKTRVGDSAQPGQGFDFLGYRFEAGRRFVRDKSLKAFKDKVRTKTIRSRGDSLGRIIGASTRCCGGGLVTSSTPGHACSENSTASSGDGCEPSCASRSGGRRWDAAKQTTCDGPMPSSRIRGCSPSPRPMKPRDTHDEETSDWRAVCGRTARTVRRAGRRSLPDPYR